MGSASRRSKVCRVQVAGAREATLALRPISTQRQSSYDPTMSVAQPTSADTQPLELTTAVAEGEMQLVLTGTDFREAVDDPEFAKTRPYWDQVLPSETSVANAGGPTSRRTASSS